MVNRKRTLFYLGVFDAIMICSVSLVGILFQQIYSTRQNTIPLYALMGQDIITFIVGTVLLITLLTENQKHIKTKIVSLGCLLYSIYIYAYFCFGLVSSLFYIIYIVILSVSVYCFIFNLFFVREDYTTLIINTKYPRKSISLPRPILSLMRPSWGRRRSAMSSSDMILSRDVIAFLSFIGGFITS